jgi:predicted O-methyltransferase YrrM
MHPDAPWLAPDAVKLLGDLIRPSDDIFEWGAGRSTRWFADRAASITSIETDAGWHAQVVASLDGHPRAQCILIEAGPDSPPSVIDSYCTALGSVVAGPVDVVLVDGAFRDRCAEQAAEHVAPGGLLIVDDVHRYLPSASRAPRAARDYASAAWRRFAELVDDWQLHWVGSGVTDTAIWIRPGGDPRLPAS